MSAMDSGTDMRRASGVLAVVVLMMTLAGCQLVAARLPPGSGAANALPEAGVCAEYEVVASEAQPVTPGILEHTRTIIEDRINATGVADPVVFVDDAEHLWIGLPGLSPENEDVQVIRHLIGAMGALEFLPVPTAYFGQVAQGAPLPADMADTEPFLNGVEIADASIGQDSPANEIIVDLEFTPRGAELFDQYAADHFGDQFAIVLDGIVQSAPTINATQFGGKAQISGNFTTAEATNLVTMLKYGPLPLEIREVGYGACEALRPSIQGPAATLAAKESPPG
jgi:SecD/SecF fusion protein